MRSLLFFLLLIPGLAISQEITEDANGHVTIQHKMELPGKSAEQIHSIIHRFYLHTFTHGTRIIQIDDQVNMVVSSGGSMPFMSHPILFKISIQYRDDALRYTITDLNYTAFGTIINTNIKGNKKQHRQIHEAIEAGILQAVKEHDALADDW
jgi:DNA gyrase/topoisomerase IV subunit B